MKPDQIAALIFGFIFVAVMLIIAIAIPNPTVSQMFIFRVVLSLAAGGIGAVIPGFLAVNVSAYVRAGGAMAVMVLVFLVNPPALVGPKPTDGDSFREAMQRGDQALTHANYPLARQFYQQAAQLKPSQWEPLYQLGRVESRDGKFAQSLGYFKSAFDKQGGTDGSIAYAIAAAEDANGRTKESRRYLVESQKLLATNSPLLPDVTYDIGLTNLELWLAQGKPKETDEYSQSDLAFRQFLEAGGQPVHWALYCQACLHAARASDQSLPDAEKKNLSIEACRKLESAVSELAADHSDKTSYQRQMMKSLLRDPTAWHREAGEPPACTDLIRLCVGSPAIAESLLAKLPAN